MQGPHYMSDSAAHIEFNLRSARVVSGVPELSMAVYDCFRGKVQAI